MLSRDPYTDYYVGIAIMIAVVFIAILWTVIVLYYVNEDADGSLSMEGREAFVLKNVIIKKALKMQDNPEIGLSTQTDTDPPGDIEEGQDK